MGHGPGRDRKGRIMAVAAEPERVAEGRRYRFTVDEFARMGEAGIFTEDDRVELIDGEILEMTPIGALHAAVVSRLTELLVTRLAGKAYVSVQNPIRLGDHTEPQPDLVVARRRDSLYTDRHPEARDIHLVIEVADPSLRYDKQEKVPRYGRAGVPETWLVDLDAREVTVYTDPGPGAYANRQVRHRGDDVVAAGMPEIRVSVDDVFAGVGSPSASETEGHAGRHGPSRLTTGHSPALIGLDVGFSGSSSSTGVARLGADGDLRLASATSTWESRSGVIGTASADVAAIDAPYTTAHPADVRSCERVFTLGRFQRRCKPGLSHVPGTGRQLRAAGWETAQQLRAIAPGRGVRAAFPRIEENANVVEAFPNAYLGVCISDEAYREMPPLRRGQKFDWLFDRWVKGGLFQQVAERIGLKHVVDLEDRFDRNRQHDERAALVCILTAAGVFNGRYAAVGDSQGGYFFLPPWQNWAAWARRELDLQRPREPNLEVWIGGIRYLTGERLPDSS